MTIAQEDPLLGVVLSERYRICELMSQGGFGKVYRAEHVTIGRPLAVKVLTASAHALDDEDRRRRFLSEARATSQIRHPHIIDIIDFGHTADGLAFYAMELLSGEDLAQMLRREGPIPWERLGPMVVQICSALATAHRLGIVHRDIKPANCFRVEMQDNHDFIKVLDFGIAKFYDPPPGMDVPRTATHAIMGTPAYMAPEFAEGVPADVRTDIYALGVLIYELATGSRPIRGADFVSTLYNHRYVEPAAPRTLIPDIPEAAEQIILRALRKSPDQRQQTMRELQEEVRASLTAPTRSPAAGRADALAVVEPRLVAASPPPPAANNEDDTTLEAQARPRPVDPPTAVARRPQRTTWAWAAGGGLAAVLVLIGLKSAGLFAPRIQGPRIPIASAPEQLVDMAPAASPAPPPVITSDLAADWGEDRAGSVAAEPPATVPVTIETGPLHVAPSTDLAPMRDRSLSGGAAPKPSSSRLASKKLPPVFDAERVHSRLSRAIAAGTETCWTKYSATPGFEFEITVVVAADGSATPQGSANSGLRRCLVDLVRGQRGLGATLTGGRFPYTFRRP